MKDSPISLAGFWNGGKRRIAVNNIETDEACLLTMCNEASLLGTSNTPIFSKYLLLAVAASSKIIAFFFHDICFI